MLLTMPKKKNTEEHQEIKPTSPIMKPETKANEKTVPRKYYIGITLLLFGSLKKSNLASTGLKYWVPANSKLRDPENKRHKEAAYKCHNFVKTMKDPSRGIDVKMNRLEAIQI